MTLEDDIERAFISSDHADINILLGVGVYKGDSKLWVEIETRSKGYSNLFDDMTAASLALDGHDEVVEICLIQSHRDDHVARLSLSGQYEGMSWDERRAKIAHYLRLE
jgi:hypothetical protein